MSRPRPSAVATAALFLVLTAATLGAGGAEAPPSAPSEGPSEPWQQFAVFLGSWQGEEIGVFGKGSGERSYRMILQGRYVLAENHSVFPPQEGLPEGDDHEDWAVFSYDRSRGTYVIRQFTSEGYVNRYILDPSSEVPERMVFVSDASENAPPGLRTRLSYELLSDNEFIEVFEIAPPGKDFGVVLRNRWRRVGGPPSEPEVSLKLGEYRKLEPGPIEEWIFSDHPSGHSRIRMAMRWKAEHLEGELDRTGGP